MEEDCPQYKYRPSATVILAIDKNDLLSKHNYEILLFERTTHTAFTPGHCVFPGGTFEEASDESQEWLDYFKNYGINPNLLDSLIVQYSCIKRSNPLLTSGKNLSRDISLRITALRETFEEVGILLFRDHETLKKLTSTPAFGEDYNSLNFDRAKWQNAVHNDAKQFLYLCQSLQIVPDLWCLYEWSLWRSPLEATKRYDTVFYFASLAQRPKLLPERTEVKVAMWQTASEFLELYKQHKIWLPPPQVYELLRLSNIKSLQNLTNFACVRSKQGTNLLTPVYYKCLDAVILALPGDEMYPTNPNKPMKVIDCSSKQLLNMTKQLHRLVLFDVYNGIVQKNIFATDGHLSFFTKNKL
ncbi:acyl-coenzyme A diphosphatase NUDT19-like [Anastrepha ludens]|uniref:acyl-coenzyme A diphosphatase NUDT19-like n=1 Tax=Anastrepha ludens TaxID=28586 RepID=UPI0023AF0910|nr:acyl-coenzyme A diphosphatase NUDT19-like [Anastrepha ludens]